jgi:proteasome lid subunit RPN8/RPN11
VRIPRSIFSEIGRQLGAAYPAEACGLLAGVRGDNGDVEVRRALALTNHRRHDGEAHHRYLIAPEDFLAAEREASAAGLDIVGVYHSHPDVAARPSAYDREHAWPWYRYLIVSVVHGAVADGRVWELKEDRSGFLEHELRIEE